MSTLERIQRRWTALRVPETLIGLAIAWATAMPAHAASETWNSSPAPDGDWNTAANWSSNSVPYGASDTATFGTSPTVAVYVTVAEVSQIVFNAGAPTYTITGFLTVSGPGIVNNSGATQNFASPTSSNGSIAFINDATAGNHTAFINNSALYGFRSYCLGDGPQSCPTYEQGSTSFMDSSNAGRATITNNGTSTRPTNASGGRTTFGGNSSAANATINNFGNAGVAIFTDNSGGSTRFYGSATAGNATIATYGGSGPGASGGMTGFYENSTAGAASFVTNGATGGVGAQGGLTAFYTTSTAGTATFVNNGNTVAGGIGGGTLNRGFIYGGATVFYNPSSAAGATLINNGSTLAGEYGGAVAFVTDTSLVPFLPGATAGNATITNNGSSTSGAFGGVTFFANSSTAAASTLIANAGSGGGGGAILFADDALGGTATIKVYGNGTLDISAHNAPGVTVGSIEGTGLVLLGSRSLGVGSNNGSTTFSGTIADGGLSGGTGGSLVKVGSGTLTLSGTNTYTGPTTVLAGGLTVNGALRNSIVTVASGGTLGGNGSVGGIVVQGGGVVAPGSPGGALTVDGNLSFAAGSTYAVGVTGAGNNDRIAVNGTATLGGGTVQVIGTPDFGASTFSLRVVPDASGRGGVVTTVASQGSLRFTVLTAAGGVAGAFAGVADDSATFTGSLSYDPNDVFLTLTPRPTAMPSLALTDNQFAAGEALMGLDAGSALSVAINRLALAAAPRAFDALSGEIHASATTAEFETAGVLGESLLDRMRWNVAGPQAAAAKTSWWGQGLGDFGHSSQGSNAAAVGRQTYGFLMGADTMIGDTLRVGAAGGYTNLRLSIPDRASSGTIDGWVGALYGRLSLGPVRVRLGGAYADTDSRIQRSVTFPGFGDSESVKYGGSTSQVFGEVGYALDEGSIAVEPLVGAAVVRVKRDAFSESGGPAALAGSGHADDIATMTTGVKAETRMVDFDAHAMVGYRHVLRGTTPDATLSFVAGGPAFTVAGVPLEKDAAVVKAALAYRMGRDVTFDAGYTGQFGHRGRDHDVTGRLTWIY